MDRIYAIVRKNAIAEIGGVVAWRAIGPTLRRALVSEQILIVLDMQAAEISSDHVRTMLRELRALAANDSQLEG